MSAQALRLSPVGEPVVEVENALRLQGRPVIHDRLYPARRPCSAASARKRLRDRPGTIYQFYQAEFGITVLRALERARAVAADRSRRTRCWVSRSPARSIEVRRTALSFNDKPVEYRVSLVDTSRHDYVNVLSRVAVAAERT